MRNLLGITSVREMDRAEYDAYTCFRERSLDSLIHGRSDLRLTIQILRDWHRDWLGEIYEWAGQYRTVDLIKGSFRWPPAQFVANGMKTFGAELLSRHTPCPAEPIEQTARRLAEVHAEFLFIHPFREGNGRLARWVASIMAMQAGYPLPEYRLSKRPAAKRSRLYISAVGQGYVRNFEPLTDFFAGVIRDSLA